MEIFAKKKKIGQGWVSCAGPGRDKYAFQVSLW